ncbi:Putative protein of unknown function [Podospora comata]|uniref:Protein kinase domain-containing protein n=1 Tax=Podospora comata TaxID=48703 RepID=A0ABY6SLU0_PODCO|nr:Putative protein of unknown function [Podospora comata]
MSAELALAVVSVVDICIKLANKTLRICQAFRTAKKDLCDKVLLLETIWTKLEIQLVFLRGIKDHLTEELAQCHFDLLQRLHGTLLQAVSQLEAAASSIVASTSTGQGHVLTRMLQLDRWRYAVAKRGLDALMTELQCWQSLFDPSWYTIMLIGGKVLDPALQQLGQDRSRQLPHNQSPASPLDHMFALRKAIDYTINTGIRSANSIVMDETGWDFTTATSVPFSSVNVVARLKSQSLYVMEGIGTAPNTNTNTTSDVYQLCRRLQSVDPSIFGLLRCKGLLEIIDDNKTFPPSPQIVYHTPAQADPLKPPTTLRSLLLEQRPVCLSSVIILAKQLVRSVSFVHTCDLVHKNIRPDNILLFPTALAALRPLELGQAFLVGFSQFRSINMETNCLGDTAWYRNLYRHPARQGLCILERYVMQHDIYSLGVCLLEIGLWRSLVWYPSTSSSTSSTYHHPNHANSSSSVPTPVPGYSLQLRKHLSDRDFEHAHLPGSTSWIKEDLVLLAKQTLPQRMGRLYTEIVVDCLTCLDNGNNEFGSSDVTHNKQDLIVVGIKFVERILGKMEGITL